jgi:hypothetical protein
MTLPNQSEMSIFLHELELSTGYQFTYPDAVTLILERACIENKTNIFDDLIFYAKFIVKTREVMNRIGQKAEGYEKLAAEIQTSIDHAIELIRILIESTTQKEEFEKRFFFIETKSFSRFIELLSDLSRFKNWQIDGKPMPYQTKSKIISITRKNDKLQIDKRHQNNQSILSLSRIQKSASLALIFMIFFLLLDPPVTVLGWMLSFGISALLAYIIMNIIFLIRTKNSR